MTRMADQARIFKALSAIEAERGVRILLAVEAGSRAWGFASPDSDYDVRFIYAHPLDWYLQIGQPRDVIEVKVDDLDIVGWDIRKALALGFKSNPGLMEWVHSPIVYRMDATFAGDLKDALKNFSPKALMHHYVSMAEGTYKQHWLSPLLKINHCFPIPYKKYLYVMRALLCVNHMINWKFQFPPVPFDQLLNRSRCLSPEALKELEELRRLKVRAAEKSEGGRFPALDKVIEYDLKYGHGWADGAPDMKMNADDLNTIFRTVVKND